MQLSYKALSSFQKLYQEKCGVWLDEKDAQIKALEELRRFALIYQPIPITDLDVFNKLNNKNNKN
ncbi:MAG: hypothetical protein HN981_04440 [Candidatus Pacebacteria bacterium]|jgi:hypothetical protein|nr:hypothetical protein [Candidatus Paceibacterota bacterium]MBT4652495.1 hypothetical protein [Candidatus Paceibacterota bacterium]MBT6756322.1 hypothetical protein [Candidatus Paceibacterota bacterium]MBT6921613.1 hypothetical protein [Candidatus Paceibacterota bacterium]